MNRIENLFATPLMPKDLVEKKKRERREGGDGF